MRHPLQNDTGGNHRRVIPSISCLGQPAFVLAPSLVLFSVKHSLRAPVNLHCKWLTKLVCY